MPKLGSECGLFPVIIYDLYLYYRALFESYATSTITVDPKLSFQCHSESNKLL